MNYIAKHNGNQDPDLAKFNDAVRLHKGTIIDDSLMPTMALVNLDDSELTNLKNELNDWDIYPEMTYKVPTTRKSIKNKS